MDDKFKSSSALGRREVLKGAGQIAVVPGVSSLPVFNVVNAAEENLSRRRR